LNSEGAKRNKKKNQDCRSGKKEGEADEWLKKEKKVLLVGRRHPRFPLQRRGSWVLEARTRKISETKRHL